jgi:hypothetical protein
LIIGSKIEVGNLEIKSKLWKFDKWKYSGNWRLSGSCGRLIIEDVMEIRETVII